MTVGDPRGIGPEIVAKALADQLVGERCDVVVVGPEGAGVDVGEAVGRWRVGGDAGLAGKLAGLAIERAVELAMAGEVDGIVTAPIDKSALFAGGYGYPGHTEMLAHLTGARVAMMLASDKLRVVLATTHIPLRDVMEKLTAATITEAARITREGLRSWFGIAEPRIALCALNPHGGDCGSRSVARRSPSECRSTDRDSILRPSISRTVKIAPPAITRSPTTGKRPSIPNT